MMDWKLAGAGISTSSGCLAAGARQAWEEAAEQLLCYR